MQHLLPNTHKQAPHTGEREQRTQLSEHFTQQQEHFTQQQEHFTRQQEQVKQQFPLLLLLPPPVKHALYRVLKQVEQMLCDYVQRTQAPTLLLHYPAHFTQVLTPVKQLSTQLVQHPTLMMYVLLHHSRAPDKLVNS